MLSKAYDMLVNHVSPAKTTASDNQDGGMSFYQEKNHHGGPGVVVVAIYLSVYLFSRSVLWGPPFNLKRQEG
jgi:hypothetical protein